MDIINHSPTIFILLSSLFITYVTSSGCTTDVTLTCQSCENKGTTLTGVVGEDLVIRIAVKNKNLMLLDLMMNNVTNGEAAGGSSASQDKLSMSKDIVKVVKGFSRFSVPASPENAGDLTSVDITLKGLTLADNGVVFRYLKKDKLLKEFKCDTAGTLAVTELKSQGSKRSIQDSPNASTTTLLSSSLLVVLSVLTLFASHW